jgi:CDP-glycerol glycerophosphotransferase (TagB/SpsB family)
MAKYKNKASLKWQFKRIFKNWFLLDLLAFTFYIFESFFKKDKKRMLFIFTKKENYADNGRCFFEYLNKDNNHNILLFIYKKELYNKLKTIFPEQTYYAYSLKGFLIFLRTKIIIISNGLDKLFFFPYYLSIHNKTIIQLWHGTPIKRIGYQVEGWNKIKKAKELQKFSKFVVCSTLERFIISSCFHMSMDNVWITDYPRNDKLLNPTDDVLSEHIYLNKKTILYAPTWREEGRETAFFPFVDVNIEEIQSFLEKNDAYLLIRGHREELDRIYNNYNLSLESTNRIKPADQSVFPNTEILLPHIDILITDYSGIYPDYLLLNRPVVFIPYDIEDYSTYRGITLDYDKYTAGPKVYTQKEFLNEMQAYIDTPHKEEDLRLNLQSVFHDYVDGEACQRLANIIENL